MPADKFEPNLWQNMRPTINFTWIRKLDIKIQCSPVCVVCDLGSSVHLQNHWNPTTGGLPSILSSLYYLNLWNNI